MAAGHGGQILVAASTAAVVSGVELVDRGEHRLRDLSGVEHLYQVRADGLRVEFAPLRTLDAVPGNLPVQTTSFVGRELEVKELAEQVRAHRLVTFTGVGGVGQDPPGDAGRGGADRRVLRWGVAGRVGPGRRPGGGARCGGHRVGRDSPGRASVTASIVQALSGRRLLVVLDNCEHVLDAAAESVEAFLARTTTVRVIATSREGLRVGAEQLWPVPSLDIARGAASAAVELFVERAPAVIRGSGWTTTPTRRR